MPGVLLGDIYLSALVACFLGVSVCKSTLSWSNNLIESMALGRVNGESGS